MADGTKKKVVPDNFKRDFFRLIKTLAAKKPGRKWETQDVKRGVRRLPTTFMVAGLATSHNKKIVLAKTLAARRAKQTLATRTRVFYRQDDKVKATKANVFMSYSD